MYLSQAVAWGFYSVREVLEPRDDSKSNLFVLDRNSSCWLVSRHASNQRGDPIPRRPDYTCRSSKLMDYIWTPWRYGYITTAANLENPDQCVFCEVTKLPDRDANIVCRGKHCFVILNNFPYTSGHVMVVPFAHLDQLQKLPEAAAREMMALSQRMEGVLRQLYSPHGINLGMNIGRAAGAGVAGHIHMHVVPRWSGDSSFMTVIGETRVLPEALEVTWERITGALNSK